MKIFFAIAATLLMSATVNGQTKIISTVTDVVLPCAKDTGISTDVINKVLAGDLSVLPKLYGCFTDCVAKKLNFLTDDNVFEVDAFSERVGRFFNPSFVPQVVDNCVSKLGSGNCQVVGPVLPCVADEILKIFLS
ncbi:Pheromone/general odorant binding protein [Sergentomyia squamirostris]